MKLAVVCDYDSPVELVVTRQDGFVAALNVLRDEWDLRFWRLGKTADIDHPYFPFLLRPSREQIVSEIRAYKPDAILVFGDFTREIIPMCAGIAPLAVGYIGGKFEKYETLADLVFVESQHYEDWLNFKGIKVKRAFGVNTDLYRPMEQKRVWDAVFPANFAHWKRHKLFAEAMDGTNSLACGYLQPLEPECWRVCVRHGIVVYPHLSHFALSYVFNSAKTCVITSDTTGGSQRTVLEAMACNVPTIVMNDSDKTSEYLKDAGFPELVVNPDPALIRNTVEIFKDKELNLRDYVTEKYSHRIYAQQLKEGIMSIL